MKPIDHVNECGPLETGENCICWPEYKRTEVEDHTLFAYDCGNSCQGYINVNDKIAELEVLRDELLDRAREHMTELYLKEVSE